MRLLHPIPGLHWPEILASAETYVSRGWPLIPGTYQIDEHGPWFGRRDGRPLTPISGVGEPAVVKLLDEARDFWSRKPYSVLLACGSSLLAVEVGSDVRDLALRALAVAHIPAPVVRSPSGKVIVLALRQVDDALTSRSRFLTLHGEGSWVPLPPTVERGAPYEWVVSPDAVNWQVPGAGDVLDVLTSLAPMPPQVGMRGIAMGDRSLSAA